MRQPETFFSIKSKMNGQIPFAVEQMNLALQQMCEDASTKPKDKLKATQDYLALYMRLDNEIQRQKEADENMKQRKLNTRIKQHQVAEIEGSKEPVDQALKQSKFSPTMTVS